MIHDHAVEIPFHHSMKGGPGFVEVPDEEIPEEPAWSEASVNPVEHQKDPSSSLDPGIQIKDEIGQDQRSGCRQSLRIARLRERRLGRHRTLQGDTCVHSDVHLSHERHRVPRSS